MSRTLLFSIRPEPLTDLDPVRRRVVSNRKPEVMANPDLDIETFRALRRKMDRLGWSGPWCLQWIARR